MAFAGSTLAAFTPPTNGGFETGTYVDNGSGFQQLDAPNTSIDGWSVDAGSVDWVGTYWPAPEGTMSIDMSGADAGTLSQTFETTIGNTYTVAFVMSGNPAGPPEVKTLEVSATGGTTGVYTHDTTGTDLTTMVWTPQTYSFLATSASTTLTFVSTTATAFGPAIDAVAVTEEVPGKDDCKDGGWESMIDTAARALGDTQAGARGRIADDELVELGHAASWLGAIVGCPSYGDKPATGRHVHDRTGPLGGYARRAPGGRLEPSGSRRLTVAVPRTGIGGEDQARPAPLPIGREDSS